MQRKSGTERPRSLHSSDVEVHGDQEAERREAEALFLRELAVIDRAIRQACWRGSLRREDAEDFASWVRLKLIEKNYEVIRRHDSRASFAAFISVVVQRLLLDYRIAQWGKWHASAHAKRIGEPALTIEAMLVRDGRTLAEIVPLLQRRWPDLTLAIVEQIAQNLPSRLPRARLVELEELGEGSAAAGSVERLAYEPDRAALAKTVATTVRNVMNDLNARDRLIFRLRFEAALSIAEIARTLRVDQKPLYRRIQRALQLLRKRLEASGVRARDADDLLASPNTCLDFGFADEPPYVAASREEEV